MRKIFLLAVLLLPISAHAGQSFMDGAMAALAAKADQRNSEQKALDDQEIRLRQMQTESSIQQRINDLERAAQTTRVCDQTGRCY